jgi:hypothetical protein
LANSLAAGLATKPSMPLTLSEKFGVSSAAPSSSAAM